MYILFMGHHLFFGHELELFLDHNVILYCNFHVSVLSSVELLADKRK